MRYTRLVLLALIIVCTTCSFDEEIDEATKKCQDICDNVINNKLELINEIVESQSQYCITPEYLKQILEDVYRQTNRSSNNEEQ